MIVFSLLIGVYKVYWIKERRTFEVRAAYNRSPKWVSCRQESIVKGVIECRVSGGWADVYINQLIIIMNNNYNCYLYTNMRYPCVIVYNNLLAKHILIEITKPVVKC